MVWLVCVGCRRDLGLSLLRIVGVVGTDYSRTAEDRRERRGRGPRVGDRPLCGASVG